MPGALSRESYIPQEPAVRIERFVRSRTNPTSSRSTASAHSLETTTRLPSDNWLSPFLQKNCRRCHVAARINRHAKISPKGLTWRASKKQPRCSKHADIRMLVKNKKEPWGQIVSRFILPEGLLVGITFTPSMREKK